MKINEASERSGVSAKMIRYYESIGLIAAPPRRDNAYRDFGPQEVNELSFIRRARGLGFSVEEVSRLLQLWRDKQRPSREVKQIVEGHILDLERRIAEMQGMAESLRHLAEACHGDARPECPILSDLAAVSGRPSTSRDCCD